MIVMHLTAIIALTAVVPSVAGAALRQPYYHGVALLRRSTSQDPSCPAGFLCDQQACPSGVICPSGQTCVGFEGTLACVPTMSTQWCALNPSSFEAVGCAAGFDGVCCHGNCYTSNATCCTDTQVQCTVGQACNVCPPGQACSGSGCVGGSPSSTTTTAKSTTSIVLPPPASPSSSTISSTTKTTGKTTTTPSVPSPTIVPSVGTFGNPACFVDSSSQRVLTNGSSTDASGLTVEECISQADLGAWQFAGVEANGQCFFGDVEINAQSTASSNCLTACPGNLTEACGGSNSILIYQDSTWQILEPPQLAAELQTLEELLVAIQQNISLWNTYLNQYEQAIQANSSSTKRDEYLRKYRRQLTQQQIIQLFQDMLDQYEAILRGKAQVDSLLDLVRKAFQISFRFQKVEQTIEIELVEKVASPLESTLTEVASSNAVVADVGADAGAAIEVSEDALAVIGTPAVAETGGEVIAAVGIFSLIDGLIDALLGTQTGTGTGNGNTVTQSAPQSTKTTSSTTRSSSTSSTCTATATQTPIIIVTKVGTTLAQYKDLVASLPQNDTNVQLTTWTPNMVYIATLNQCQTDNLTKNAIVDTWMIDAILDDQTVDDPMDLPSVVDNSSSSSGSSSSSNSSKRSMPVELHEFQTRDIPTANSIIRLQTSSPGHLQWLSELAEYPLVPTGDYLAFRDVIYNDPATTNSPIVYVIDESGFRNTHQSIAPVLNGTIAIDHNANILTAQTPPTTNHGTCMASLAAGLYSSMGKHTRLVTVQLGTVVNLNAPPDLSARQILAAAQGIYNHAVDNNGLGNAVVSMSWAIPGASLYWQQQATNPAPVLPDHNAFETFFNNLWNVGIATVSSAGNMAGVANVPANQQDLGYHLPRSMGGTNSKHIVVGNAQYDSTRYMTSQYADAAGQGILTVYNVGTNVDCATPLTRLTDPSGQITIGIQSSDVTWGVENPGSSQATAITAGQIAYWLSQPDIANSRFRNNGLHNTVQNIKNYLIEQANLYKGNMGAGNTPNGLPDNVPRAATGDIVPCPGGSTPQAVPVPPLNAFVPNPGFNRAFQTTQVTQGTNVVFAFTQNQCYAV